QDAEVLIDGVVLGRTPWEGAVSVGPHAVLLRGPGELGSQPASASVREGERTTLTLTLEPLSCTLRISPTPSDAEISLDGVALGRGTWQGRVRAGVRRVEG